MQHLSIYYQNNLGYWYSIYTLYCIYIYTSTQNQVRLLKLVNVYHYETAQTICVALTVLK